MEFSGVPVDINNIICAQQVDCIRLTSKGDYLYVDDVALVTPGAPFSFMWMGFPQVIIGKALVVGFDEHGEFTDTTLDLDAVTRCVVWVGQIEIT